MSERGARLLLAGLVVAVLAAASSADLARLSGGAFWGDGATYYSMAWSLAEDGDLEYEVRDLLRVRREFASGPQGVFLKRSSGGLAVEGGFPWLRRLGETERRVYFAKPFVYPLAAAPFVRLLGTRGLLVTSALALALSLVLGYLELRRRAGPGQALALAVVLYLGTVTPVYVLWPAPEVFNLGLVAAGLFAWRRERPWLSALLLGVATYSKPYNLWLAIPLGLSPFWPRAEGRAFVTRLAESLRRGALLLATAAALFGANAAITGEWNYQGGRERKTFYDKFPGDTELVGGVPRLVTFGNSGHWMSTNELGPRVEGDGAPLPRGSEPPRAASEIRQSFVWNLLYFWVGRFGGALPYFFPFVAGAAWFLLKGRREPEGWLALLALAVSYLFYIAMIPDNWYGGTGTLGNRYFLNLLPLGLYLVPRGSERTIAVAGAVAAAVFLSPILASPMRHSLRPGEHALHAPFPWLPAELTMLNDLGVFTEPWRKKQPVGDTEGDAATRRRADPRAYYLYFADDGTYGLRQREGRAGFDLKAGARAEVFLRALEPVRRMTFRVAGGTRGDGVAIDGGAARLTLPAAPGATVEGWLTPGSPLVYKDTFVYVLKLSSSGGGPDASGRPVGAFVEITLDVDARSSDRGARGASPALVALLFSQQRVQTAPDLLAAIGGAGFEQPLSRRGGDRKVLAGQVHPGHRLLRAALLVQEAAQDGMGVQVAGQRLDGRAPFVAGVAVVERLRLRDQGVPADEAHDLRAAQAVELQAPAALLDADALPDFRDRADDVQILGPRHGGLGVLLGDGEHPAARAVGDLERLDGRGARDHEAQRRLRKQAQLAERQHRQQQVEPGHGRLLAPSVRRHGTTSCL